MSDADYAEMLIAGVLSPGGGRVTDVYASGELWPCSLSVIISLQVLGRKNYLLL